MSETKPLLSGGVDLRDFAFMPLDIGRLFNSEFHAKSTDAEWRAGVTLWLKSWHQVPAASLPSDEVSLARLAEFGRDLKGWRKVRDGALYGWIECSDGRLYHPVVAEKAREAWERKCAQRDRTEKARAARQSQRLSQTPEASVTNGATWPVTASKGQGQGQGQGEEQPQPPEPEVRAPKRANGAGYAFEGRHIRLKAKDFGEWEKAFPHLSLRAELVGLDEWAGEQGTRWFPAVSSALAKKERAAVDRLSLERERAQNRGPPLQDPRL